MKTLYGLAFFIIILFAASGCSGKGSGKKDSKSENETVSVPDTGFTGIKRYKSKELVQKEVTFKNGVREGLTKTFDMSGQLYQTFWYVNNLREDSACWYYPQGQVFRITPYKHDTVDGIQKQYYRTGELRARIGYIKGLRTRLFEEFDRNGRKVGGYPGIVTNIVDEYSTRGVYHVGLEMSDKRAKVKFYRGDFTNDRFDTTMCKIIKTTEGKGMLDLRKSGQAQPNSVSVIAEIVSPLGNRYFTVKKIDLPYNDLK